MRNISRKDVIDELRKQNSVSNKDNMVINTIKITFLIIALVVSVIYLIYTISTSDDQINRVYLIINSSFITGLMLFLTLALIIKKKTISSLLSIFTALIFIFFIGFNISASANKLKLPLQATLKDFTNANINDALLWANEHDISIETLYVNSDDVEEGYIISQDIKPNTLLKGIKKIVLTISSGPNYDKEVILSNMVGWDIDEALKVIKDNFLNNVVINFEVNESIEKNVIITQSINGQIKRNTKVVIVVSLGKAANLTPIEIIDLKNKSLFDATYYLQSNGIKYELTYEFSDKIKKDYIISQSAKKGTTVDPKIDKVTLIVSKGKEIKSPDLKDMKVDEIVNWVIKNNLKITFEEKYDYSVKLGEIISVNYKENDIISEGTIIKVITSKGQLMMKSFNSLSEFRTWAASYNIAYKEVYEYNSTIGKGNIIKLSQEANTPIDPTATITVYVSNGKPITVPYFIGKSKSTIISNCNSLGLNCTFYYTGYSNTTKDVATNQNVASGATVISGTYVNIGLSSGPAATFNVYIQDTLFGATADATIANLKSYFNANCPGVYFAYVKRSSNTGAAAGFIHEDSPIKGGNNSFTQGRTYTIWVIQ